MYAIPMYEICLSSAETEDRMCFNPCTLCYKLMCWNV